MKRYYIGINGILFARPITSSVSTDVDYVTYDEAHAVEIERDALVAAIKSYIDAAGPLMYKPSFSTKSPSYTAQAEFRKAQLALITALESARGA